MIHESPTRQSRGWADSVLTIVVLTELSAEWQLPPPPWHHHASEPSSQLSEGSGSTRPTLKQDGKTVPIQHLTSLIVTKKETNKQTNKQKLGSTGYSALPSPRTLMQHCDMQSRLNGHVQSWLGIAVYSRGWVDRQRERDTHTHTDTHTQTPTTVAFPLVKWRR